ncbi:MFS transporter [Streptomyces sp. NBC_00250]|uniref:bifunctional serine/threonine protein kinase/MFS transporter n=1 Tax=Streptomyces sp. NBC_00250 TaxID=2903641 RepID=UPI002E2DAF3F|nr:MFS transporter [Streptomyces sp. NBC_00250]
MDALTPEDPTYVGPYRLIARLGAGGMGLVYLGRSDMGRTVAVKVVQAEFAAQPEFRRRFAREVAAARRVGGNWTADVLDADTDTEVAVPWVATQYIAGPDLTSVVARDFGPLPEHSVRVLANRLALALQVVHDAGLIHRDLKPSNVLVTVDGPRVIDFGIARAMDSLAGDSLHTRTGMLIGSPGFMSPEQVRGLELTPASDVFCLGAVLVYASTGRLLFGATDTGLNAHLFRVAEEEPDLTNVPDSLLGLVRTCLEKDPAKRPTPPQIAAQTGGDDGGVWLPGEVLVQLGRHAAQLLDYVPAARAEASPASPVTESASGTPASPAYAPASPALPAYTPTTPSTPAPVSAPASTPPPFSASAPTAPAHGVPAPSPRRRGTLAVIVLAQLAALFGATAGHQDYYEHDSPESYAFGVTFAALLFLGGHLADRVGGRRTLVIGLSGLAVASVLGIASAGADLTVLITARVLQGGFGALVTAAALALVSTAFPEQKGRRKAFGVYASVSLGGPALPMVTTGAMGWGPALGIVVILALISLAASRVLPLDRPDRTGTRFDVPGILLGTLGVGALGYGFANVSPNWNNPLVIGPLVVGLLLCAAFLWRQSVASSPLLPSYALKERNRLGGFLTMLLAAVGVLALVPALTRILMWSFGHSVAETGLAMLPMVVAIALSASLIAPRLLNRSVAPRVLIASGLVITPFGVALGIFGIENGGGNALLQPSMILAGLGAGLAFMPIFATVTAPETAAVIAPVTAAGPDRYAGGASAALLTAQAVGGGLGAALVGGIDAPPWWAVLCTLLAALTAGLTVTGRGLVPPGEQLAPNHRP